MKLGDNITMEDEWGRSQSPSLSPATLYRYGLSHHISDMVETTCQKSTVKLAGDNLIFLIWRIRSLSRTYTLFAWYRIEKFSARRDFIRFINETFFQRSMDVRSHGRRDLLKESSLEFSSRVILLTIEKYVPGSENSNLLTRHFSLRPAI